MYASNIAYPLEASFDFVGHTCSFGVGLEDSLVVVVGRLGSFLGKDIPEVASLIVPLAVRTCSFGVVLEDSLEEACSCRLASILVEDSH